MAQVIPDLAQAAPYTLHLLVGAVDVVQGNPPDGDLEQGIDVLGSQVLHPGREGFESRPDRVVDLLLLPDLLDALVDPFLYEELFQRLRAELRVELLPFDFQFGLEDLQEPARIVLQDFGNGQYAGVAVPDDQRVGGNGRLAVGEGVERVHRFLGVHAPRQPDFDFHLVRREVGDAGNLQLVLLRRRLDGPDQALGGRTEGQLADDDALGVPHVQVGADRHLSVAVVVSRGVHQAPRGEIGQDLERFVSEAGDLGLHELDEVVGQDPGRHARGDAFRPQGEEHGDLRREGHRLPVAAVVGVHVFGDFRVVQRLFGQRRQPAFDVPGRRGGVSGQDRPEIALLLDEHVLVGQVDQRPEDRLVPVGMVPHGLAHHVGDLVVLPVVHLEEGVENAALHRLEPVVDLRYGAVLDEVGGVLQVVVFEEFVGVSHGNPILRPAGSPRCSPCARACSCPCRT